MRPLWDAGAPKVVNAGHSPSALENLGEFGATTFKVQVPPAMRPKATVDPNEMAIFGFRPSRTPTVQNSWKSSEALLIDRSTRYGCAATVTFQSG